MNKSDFEVRVDGHMLFVNLLPFQQTLTFMLSDIGGLHSGRAESPLIHATEKQTQNFELIGDATGLHWPDLDEDISLSRPTSYFEKIDCDKVAANKAWYEKLHSKIAKGEC